jgi:hypothetical protein
MAVAVFGGNYDVDSSLCKWAADVEALLADVDRAA